MDRHEPASSKQISWSKQGAGGAGGCADRRLQRMAPPLLSAFVGREAGCSSPACICCMWLDGV